MPTFGVSIYSVSRKILCGEWSPVDAVTWLAENGAEAIELVPFGIDIVNDGPLRDGLCAAAEKTGVPLANYSLNANFLQISLEDQHSEMARVKSHIDACAAMHIPSIRVDCSSYRRAFDTTTTENFQKEMPTILDVYRTLCDYAAQYNIKILLENHGFHINGAERMLQIVSEMSFFPSVRNFGIQLDVGNFECVDDRAEIAATRLLPVADTLHMKDFYLRTRDPGDATMFDCAGAWFRSVNGRYLRGAILGQGDLDIPAVVGAVKRAGFDGNLFVEFEGLEDCLYGTRVSLDNLKRLYAESQA